MRLRTAPLLVVLAVLVFAIVMLPGFGQPPVERVDNGTRVLEAGPFTLSVGRYYLLFTPDNRPIPTDRSPVLALRAYPNGWVDVKTLEDQVLSVNMSHMMQVVRIDDIEKWRKLSSK